MKFLSSPTQLLLGLLASVIVFAPPSNVDGAKEDSKHLTGLKIAELIETKRIDFPGFDDPKLTLEEALDQLFKKRYDVPFEINEKAFTFENLQDVPRTEIANPKPFPPMQGVTLSYVLRKILDKVPVPSGAAYLIRDHAIEVTTGRFVLAELGRELDEEKQRNGQDQAIIVLMPRLMFTAFNNRPLEETLELLADRSGRTIVLDPSLGEKGKTPISVTLRNVPLDTSLRLLAEMVDLRMMQLDNTYFLTSPEKALRLEKEQAQRKRAPKPITGPMAK